MIEHSKINCGFQPILYQNYYCIKTNRKEPLLHNRRYRDITIDILGTQPPSTPIYVYESFKSVHNGSFPKQFDVILGRALCVLPRAVTLRGGGDVETHIRPKRSDLPPITDVELGPCVALCVLHV